MRVATAPRVAWLHTWVRPIPGIRSTAYLLTQYPFDKKFPVRSWAWWGSGVWIGPRHTNFPHGDICAYNLADGTWHRDTSLVTLLDLHVVWIVRHLHLQRFGRWPGRQVLHTTYERLQEMRRGELCGCGSANRYEACCQPDDEGVDLVQSLRKHIDRVGAQRRRPPMTSGRLPSPAKLAEPKAP